MAKYFFVYILKSFFDGSQYVGMSSNPENRLLEHNRGKVRSTKKKVPWKIIYLKDFPDRASAREHEVYLKSAAGRRFRQKLLGN